MFQWVATGRRATAAVAACTAGTGTARRRSSWCCRSCRSRPSRCRRSGPSRRRPCSARPAPRATTTSTSTHNTPLRNILSLTVSIDALFIYSSTSILNISTEEFILPVDFLSWHVFCLILAEEEDEQEDDDIEPLALGADTTRVEEIPPKEPIFNAVPLKSALKKRPAPAASPAATPLATPLAPRQDHHHTSFKSVPPPPYLHHYMYTSISILSRNIKQLLALLEPFICSLYINYTLWSRYCQNDYRYSAFTTTCCTPVSLTLQNLLHKLK